jgi:hypothetical protein
MSEFKVPVEDRSTVVGRVGRFHFPAARPLPARFRLVAILEDGQRAVIRMGQSRNEVEATPLPLSEAIRGRVIDLLAEQWVGRWTDGCWHVLPARRKWNGRNGR